MLEKTKKYNIILYQLEKTSCSENSAATQASWSTTSNGSYLYQTTHPIHEEDAMTYEFLSGDKDTTLVHHDAWVDVYFFEGFVSLQ